MKTKSHKNTWRKLDNTAKIFSLEDKKNTNIFRYSALLKDNIDSNKLSKSLNKTLEDYPTFKVKIGTGLFWNYLEYNDKEPILKEENENLCEPINFRKNNDYLFKVTYDKNKINLDIFHVLTDGTGAIIFFKTLLYHYLHTQYKLPFAEKKYISHIGDEDLCLKYYNKASNINYDFKPAYQIPSPVNKGINNTYLYTIRVKEIKQVCKRANVTITEYLTAIYIYALYLSLYDKDSNQEISITIPINLRKHYQEETLINFFTYMNVTSNLTQKENITFEKILKHIHHEFIAKLTEEKIKNYLARDVNLGMNLSIRLVPLLLKKLFIKFMGSLVMKSSTSTLSNIGVIETDDQYKKYIDNIVVSVLPSKIQKIKCTICSFKDQLNITLNSNIDDTEFQTTFLTLLQKQIKNIKIKKEGA